MKILIAEDDPTLLRLLTVLVEFNGHEIVALNDGLKAWQALEQPGGPQLALLDWNMPGLTGIEICRKVRAANLVEPRHLILITGKTDRAEIDEGLAAGADDYLIKPFCNDDFDACVARGVQKLGLS